MKKIFAILGFIVLSFLLSGCREKTETYDTDEYEKRWVYKEEKMILPEGIKKILAMENREDIVWLITDKKIYFSEDNGEIWKEYNKTVLPELCEAAAVGENGKFAFVSETEGILIYNENNQKQRINIEMGNPCTDISFVGDNNTVIIRDAQGNMDIVDLRTNEIQGQISGKGKVCYLYAALKNEILLYTENGVEFYDYNGRRKEGNKILSDLVQNEKLEEKMIFSGAVIADDLSGQGIFYISERGIFHYTEGGSVTEQIIEGSSNKLGDTRYELQNAVPLSGNGFLVSYGVRETGELVLLRYMPSESENKITKLTLYTLHENSLLREEINIFNQSNSEIAVNIEVGAEEQSSVTEEDAIRTLNTEILAGRGPDIIMLDGMNVERYIEKGILSDISEPLKFVSKEEGLYENIAYTYKNGKGIYAVPARFEIPIMVGKKEILERIQNLESFEAEVQNLKKENLSAISVLNIWDRILLSKMMDFCSPLWISEQGKMEKEKIQEFLSVSKEINDIQKISIDTTEMEEQYISWNEEQEENVSIANVAEMKNSLIGIFNSKSLNALRVSLHSLEKEKLDYKTSCGQSTHTFVPRQIIGINAKSEKQSVAVKFLQRFLSSECQSKLGISDRGYPINKAAFHKMAEQEFTYSMDGDVKKQVIQKNFDKVEEIIEELKNRSITDYVILNTVSEQGIKYLQGSAGLEETVDNIMKKLNLYMTE